MDSHFLESLIKVVEFGSIARAAKAQHLTAAAVGQRIAILETQLGAKLLDRSSREATPTEACLRLLPRARHVVRELRDMKDSIAPDGLTGRFRIGTIAAALVGILPSAVRKLSEIAPGLTLEIKLGSSESLYADLDEHFIDAAVLILPGFDLPSVFEVNVLREEPLVLLSRNCKRMNRLEKLSKNPYIQYDSRSWGGRSALQYLKDNNLELKPFCEFDTPQPIEKLVAEGMGVSLVPLWTGFNKERTDLDHEIIREKRYRRKMAIITHQNSTRNLLNKTVVEALQASANSNSKIS